MSRLCCQVTRPLIEDIFLPLKQLGVAIPGGLEAAIHLTRSAIDRFQYNEDFCLLKLDFQNAFNECSRQALLNQVAHNFPDIYNWVQWSYCTEAMLKFGEHTILSTTGVQQGDPLGPLLFALVLAQLTASVPPMLDMALELWYLDDGVLVGPRRSVVAFYDHIIQNGPSLGLHLNNSKCELFWPSGDPSFPEFHPDIIRQAEGITLLGSPVWGSREFMVANVQALLNKTFSLQSLITELDNPQIELHLLRSCLSTCKVIHLLRSVPIGDIGDIINHFDLNLRSSLSQIMHCTLTDEAWLQATLPLRLGGLGLREASPLAPIAFSSSCALAHSIASRISLDYQVPFIGEMSTINHLTNLSLTPPPTGTQASMQAEADARRFDHLMADSNIRDKARLIAISNSKETNAWLKAVPLPSVGLAMPPAEFLVDLCIWLGLPVFPSDSALTCSCSAFLDQNGDHMMSCGSGPYRIGRHDALKNVLFNALKQDNPNVRQKQGIDVDSRQRPGDIFHPDFHDGKPTYFDISVVNPLQPGSINEASRSAGVAAARREEEKDGKFNESVSRAGGAFIPLVVESLGRWSPFACKMLKIIASRTTLRNGLSEKVAYRNLIEQLSTRLWAYNAKLILRHFATLPVDPLWDVP